MLSSQITELAFRAAVNTGTRNVSSDSSGLAESIQDSAEKRASTLLQANCSGSSLSTESMTQATLIAASIAVLKLSYDATIEQISDLKQKRLSFDKERISGTASFCIPTRIEEASFSIEEKIIQSFLDFTNYKTSSASRLVHSYLGIHYGDLSDNSDYRYYSVMPFYKMSQGVAQPVASKKPIDSQRTMISLFFKASLAEVFQKIDFDFQMDWRITSFTSSVYHGPNYLNNRRAPRFIIMCLGNLLWNLQHPVDLESGFQLNMAETLEVCRQAELFLNGLLDENKPPFIRKICNETNGLLSIIRQIEVKVKALRAAYIYEQLHELNIEEINHTGHRALRLMDQSLLKLIYHVYNPTIGKKEPNELAADSIADTIGYLNQLIHRNKDKSILKLFDVYRHLVKSNTGFNLHSLNVESTPIKTLTVIDVLIIYCHMRPKDRKELLKNLNQINGDSSIEFSRVLSDFYYKYIKRIKHFVQEELDCSRWNNKEDEVAIMTARRIIPIMTLVLADYRIDVDMDWPYVDLYICSELPNSTLDIKNSYIYLKDSGLLYYINLNDELEKLIISNTDEFNCVLDGINVNKKRIPISLTKKNIWDLITAFTNHTPDFIRPDILDGRQQVQLINSEASGKGKYYFWNLAPLLLSRKYSEESGKQFDQFPFYQYRITQMTQIMDLVMGLISEYRHFLQDPKFQEFLIYTMTRIKIEYKAINDQLDNMDDALADDENINRSLNGILRPLLTALDHSIRGFTLSVEHFQKVISSPDFLKNQRQILVQKLKEIYKYYIEIFGSDKYVRLIYRTIESERETSNSFMYRTLSKPVESTSNSTNGINPSLPHKDLSINQLKKSTSLPHRYLNYSKSNELMTIDQVQALKELAQHSYYAMSYLSRWRSKGWNLYSFINNMNETKSVEKNIYKNKVLRLTKIVLTPSYNWFLTASYGKTNSAKPLIEAIKNKKMESRLPIASILFGRNALELSKLTDEDIINQMEKLPSRSR